MTATDPWGAPPQTDPWAGMGSQQQDPWGASAPSQPAAPAQKSPASPPPDADSWFGEAGAKGFSFDGTPPMRLGGQVVEILPLRQKTNMDTGQPVTFKDGTPRWVMPVLCQTDMREDPDDDGIRAHYLEFNKKKAVLAAMKRAGRQGLPEIGSHLYLTYLAPKPAPGQAKKYEAEYYPPGVTPPAVPPTPGAAAPQPGYTAPPPAAGPPPQAQIAMQAGAPQALAQALCAAGMTVEEAQRLPGLAAGWQNATAEQIMPYIRSSRSSEPPF